MVVVARPRSAPASPRSRSAGAGSSVDGVFAAAGPLTKAEFARLCVESGNFQWARAHKQAASARRNNHMQLRTDMQQSLIEQALFTKERVRSGMRRAVEQSRQEASKAVTAQREYLQEMERRRNELRAAHAAYGKELHDRHYGSDAALKRAQAQEVKGQERQELARKGAALEAERHYEQGLAVAARSASVERVRQQIGFHVMKSIYGEETSARKAAAQAQRAHSAEVKATVDAMKEQRRHRAEESRERVLSLEAQSKRERQAEAERKHFRATLIRQNDHDANVAADQVRQDTARRRKSVHDLVLSEKMVFDLPVPPLAFGVGGIAGSRKAAIAAFFAPRESASKKATAEGSSAIPRPVDQSHATTRAPGFIFDPGPTGITMKEVPAGVIVADVTAGSQAFALKVPLGGIILSVNGHPVYGLSWIGVNKAISKANWPMTLLIAPCTKCTFEGHTDRKGRVHITPVGFTLKDMQNGVIIDKVVPDSSASKQELLSGAFLVTVNDLAAVGMSSRDIGPLLKSRPLTLQTVPREVAYLFRPKGVFSNLRRKPRRLQHQPAGTGPDDGSDVHRADCVL